MQKVLKFFWKNTIRATGYLRVWYDFSPRQRRVENGKKMTKKRKKRTGFEEKSGKIEQKAEK